MEGTMAWNVPDDWNSYYRKCYHCGSRYHASEGGCECERRREADESRCDYYNETLDNCIGVEVRKTRRNRTCCGCGETLYKGSKYARVCAKAGGTVWAAAMHEECWLRGSPLREEDRYCDDGPDYDPGDRYYDEDYLADRAADAYERHMYGDY